MRHCILGFASTLLMLARAHADDALGTSHVAPVLPTVKLEAKTDGKAKFKVGVDFTTGQSRNVDRTITVGYETTTSDGVSQLFSFDENGAHTPADWQFGIGGTLTLLRPFRGPSREVSERTRAGLTECLSRCALKAVADDDKLFCTAALAKLTKVRAAKPPAPAPAAAAPAPVDGAPPAPPVVVPAAPVPAPQPLTERNLDPPGLTEDEIYAIQDVFSDPTKEFCPAGRQPFKVAEEATRDKSAVLPQGLVSGAVQLGGTTIDYVAPDEMDPMLLREGSSKKGSMSAVVLALYNHDGIVLELGTKLQSKYTGGSKKLHYCIPAGTVTTTSGMGSAESCSDRSVGLPKQQNNGEIWLSVGTVNSSASSRISLAMFYSRNPVDGPDDKRNYGVRIPMLLSTDVLPGPGVYKGMLRITPTISFVETEKDDGFDAKFLVVLEVLTARSLFGNAFDAL